jgi:hypothetical protein
MRIASDGSVRIGKSTNYAMSSPYLMIGNSANTNELLLSNQGSTQLGGFDGSVIISTGGSNNLLISSDNGFTAFGYGVNNGYTSYNEAMRIESSGNILIGATGADIGGSNTGIRFNQAGSILASIDETTASSFVSYFDRRGTNNEGSVIALALQGFFKASIGVIGTSANVNDGGITFNTLATNGGFVKTERMRIDSDGNVGIGTVLPNAKLEVASGQAKTVTSGVEFARFGTSNEASNYATLTCEVKGATLAADRKWIFQTIESGVANAGNIVFQPSGGNVGIGTDSPGVKLEVEGSTNAIIKMNSTAGTGGRMDFAHGGSIYGNIGSGKNILGVGNAADMMINADSLLILGVGSQDMTILPSGYVGIGTTSPGSKLSVSGLNNGVSEFTTTLGSTSVPNGTVDSLNTAPRNKTLLTGYSIPYTGVSNAALSPCGFLGFNSAAGWTGNQRNWAITSGYDIGGTGGNKLAILVGNNQGVNPEIGDNGSVGAGTGAGVNTVLACYWTKEGEYVGTGDVVAFSDKKLKKNIKTLDGSKVFDMRGVSFTRKDTGKNGSGVIAQEIQKIAPELVNDTGGTLGVAYGNISGYLIEAIKEQQEQIKDLRKEINLLKNN